MTTRTAVVTGGLGYIGSHTVYELLSANYNVIILDNCCNSDKSVLSSLCKLAGDKADRIKHYPVDITVENQIYMTIGNQKPDLIIHFAALKNVGESNDLAQEYYYNNILSLLNILRYAKDVGCHNFIFSSSATVYPHSAPLPYTESSGFAGASSDRYPEIINGPHPYGNTKIICEQILQDIVKGDKTFGWNITVLRYFNPVGAHPSGLLGDPYKAGKANNLFPAILGAHIRDEPLSVFGSDYNTSDGTAIRDYIHVVDLARAHVMVDIDTKGIHTYNVGLGNGHTVLEVINKFQEKGFEIKYNLSPRREGDVEASYCDNKKLTGAFGWVPLFNLDDMVTHTLGYFNKFHNKNSE
jgi:UDP-glucose 4-epimerase